MSRYNKTHCEKCGSKDNMIVWNNGTGKCMTPGCNNMIRLNKFEESVEELDNPLIEGLYTNLPERGISLDTCEAYDYRTSINDNGIQIHIANHRIGDEVVAQQLRYPDKSFPWINGQKAVDLFGLHLCNNYEKPIYITEGQIDAMSIYEASNGELQAVSIPRGSADAKNALKNNLDKLKKFKKIILFFDNDVINPKTGEYAGYEALKQCIPLLPLGKGAYIDIMMGKIPEKDANELLTDKGPEILLEVLDKYYKEIMPIGITKAADLDYRKLLEPVAFGHPIPHPILNEAIRGIQKSRLYMIGAGTGCGKTEVLKWICGNWIFKLKGIKIANIFLEESQKQTLQSYIAHYANVPTYKFAEDPSIVPEKIFNEAKQLLSKSDALFLDHFGSLESPRLIDLLEYCASKVDVIVLDHISIAISGNASSREGERKDIDILMTKLKQLTASTGVSIIAVSHLTRPQGIEGFEDGKPVTLNSFRGSGSLAQLSDVVIGLERNTQHPTDKDKLGLRILKNRVTGKLGKVGELYYMENNGRLFTSDEILNYDNPF